MTGVAGRIEMALAPDRTADPLSWDWTGVTDSAKVETLAISHGQTSGGANEMQPGSMSFPVLNPGGIYTPGRADSPHYPNLVLGTPVRAVVTGQRDPYLALTGEAGSRCSTPDNAALDITGDISVAMEFECPLRVPASGVFWELAAKWNPTGDQRSWRFLIRPEGLLYFEWSTAGTSASTLFSNLSTGVPRADSGILTVGVYLDVDVFGLHAVHWYVAPGKTITDLIASPATYEVATDVVSGTTSIFSSTATVDLGDNPNDANNPASRAKVRRAILRSGTMDAGTIIANPTFTAQTPGATSFTDSASRVWTVNSPASISDDQVRMIGELASNSPRWPALSRDEVAETEWEVMGPLSRMRQGGKALNSCLRTMVTAPVNKTRVVAYWPLEDGTDASEATSPIAGVGNMGFGDTVGDDFRFAADNTLVSSNPLPHINGTIKFGAHVPPYSATHSRVDLFARIDTPNTSPATTVITAVGMTGTAVRWVITVNNTTVAITAQDATGGSLLSTTFAAQAAFFGTWCIWSLDVEQSGGNIAWAVEVVPLPGGVAFGTSGSFAGTVGVVGAVHNWNTPAPTSGGISYGHIIVSTGTVQGWLAPADTAFDGEPAAQRFFRLCQEQGIPALVDGTYAPPSFWPAAMTAGAKPMGPQLPLPLLDLLSECAAVENARIGESKELFALTYRANYENQTPALTVSSELGNPFEPTGDSQGVVNDATVTIPRGSSHRQVDQDSIDVLGVYDASREVNASSVLQLPDLTSWWLHDSLWPGLRVPVLRIELGNNPALFDNWLALSPGDLVRITGLPPGFPETELDVLVDGYTEELSVYHYGLILNVRPGGPWEVGVRNDADLGIRDTGGSVLNAQFIAGTNTNMDVATTLGPLWAVTAASNTALPFDVNVGGARVTVTAIGAAAGAVQTFTVTQAPVNGISKTIPAGTAVSVWRPARRAL